MKVPTTRSPFRFPGTLLAMLACSCGDKSGDKSGDNPADTDTTAGTDSDPDKDGDGYPASKDCDDTQPGVYPGATEACNEVDDNCDGEVDEGVQSTWYLDADGDGYGDHETTRLACTRPEDCVRLELATDCDDANDAAHPGAIEVCDELDNDCDELVDEDVGMTYYADADGDGYGDREVLEVACEAPSGMVADYTDCDDGSAEVNPGADEVCGDGSDNDCNGLLDCEDAVCFEDMAFGCGEWPCDDGIDNDLDGLTDCPDDECWGTTPCLEATITVLSGHAKVRVRDYGSWGSNRISLSATKVTGLAAMQSAEGTWAICDWSHSKALFVGSSSAHGNVSGGYRKSFAIDSGCGLSSAGFLPTYFLVGKSSFIAFSWISSSDFQWYAGARSHSSSGSHRWGWSFDIGSNSFLYRP